MDSVRAITPLTSAPAGQETGIGCVDLIVSHPTKISACRAALELVRRWQLTVLHCLGTGGATRITEEAKKFGIMALAGVPSRVTDLT